MVHLREVSIVWREGKGNRATRSQGRLPDRGRGNAAFRWCFARSVPMGTPTHFDDQDLHVFLGRAPALHIPQGTSLFSWVRRPHCTFPQGTPASPLGLVYHPSEQARGLPPRPPMRGQSDYPETVAGLAHTAPPVSTSREEAGGQKALEYPG